jgi:uncharacterized protein (TIRG00374 family)
MTDEQGNADSVSGSTAGAQPPGAQPAGAPPPSPEPAGAPPKCPHRASPEQQADPEGGQPDLSLAHRLRQPRTIISLVLLFVGVPPLGIAPAIQGFHIEELPGKIAAANPLLLLAAFVVFYLGFPLRGLRWAILVRQSGFQLKVGDSMEIIFLSWLVNCLVPAKLGDVYRAWLLKINSTVSLSRTFGTVFIERILDLFAIVTLGLAAGFWSFRGRLPPDVQVVFAIGVVFVLALALGLLTLRNFGRRIIAALPLPHKVIEFYDRFEEGVFASIGLRALPQLVILTGLIWGTEAMRLFLVVEAFGFPDVHLGISGAFFVALCASLLTAVPLTPAGIGFVEGGVVGLLTLVYNVSTTDALAITLVDRAISVLSIIVLGSIAYAISPKRRGLGVSAATSG